MKSSIKNSPVFIVIFFTFGGLLGGYLLSVIAGATPFLIHDFSLTTGQLSTIMGLILFGGIFAKLVLLFNDCFGRKAMVYFNLFLFIIGIVIFTFAQDYRSLFIGRFIQGSAAIMSTVVFPVYLSEISSINKRGRMITVFQLAWTTGMLLAGIVNIFFAQYGSWKAMFNVALIIPIILLFFVRYLPVSPRWLVMKGRTEAAKDVIINLNKGLSHDAITTEINAVANGEQVKWLQSFPLILKYKKAIFYAITIFVLTQLCGINAIMQTSVIILKNCGIHSDFMAIFGTILISATNFIMTVCTIILVDKLGRKKILMIGIAGFVISMIILSGITGLFPHTQTIGWLSLICIIIAVGFVAFGPCGVVYVLLAEVLPTPVRTLGFIIGGFFSIIVGTIFASKFILIGASFGYSLLFGMIAFFAAIYFVFCKTALPETSGKSLEEIESEMS
jgi:sugar porter (SP) family MFS transporter